NANLTGATVQITTGCLPEDALSFTNAPPIFGSYTSGTCTMALSGTDTVANYQSALRAVKYANSSNDPNTTTRVVSFQATDGQPGGTSNTLTRNIAITAVNDAPVN